MSTQSRETSVEVANQVIDADRRRFQAMIKLDEAGLNELLADDLVYMHSTGAFDSKASLISGLLNKKFAFKSAEHLQANVRAYGDMAVLNGRVQMVVHAGGTDHNVSSAFTTIWHRRNEKWRLIHWQSTPLPKP